MADMPRAFVAGHPIDHSRSPLIHATWLQQNGLSGSYEAVDVAPERFSAFVSDIKRGEWIGGNVTIPHKEAVCALADRRDGAVQAIGAANTLWIEGGKLIAGNTDAYGFSANLDDRLAEWRDGRRALVLGAGGASRAVVHALLEAGYGRVDIVNRTLDRAHRLVERFGDKLEAHDWSALGSLLGKAEFIVNTTSLGMEGQPPLKIDLQGARSDAMATDIVYVPLDTPFLKLAAVAGLKTCDGLGMLLHQAAPGFEHWFGRRPTVNEELRALIVSDLGEKAGT